MPYCPHSHSSVSGILLEHHEVSASSAARKVSSDKAEAQNAALTYPQHLFRETAALWLLTEALLGFKRSC